MKILFLDIDGVCNSEASLKKSGGGIVGIDPYMAFLVGKIVLDTGCKVVLSSSWRHSPEGIKNVEKHVVKVLDRTPSMPRPIGTGSEYGERGREIQKWLKQHPEVEKYAILDDDSDMLPEQMPNFFKTWWKEGLTKETAEAVTKHLNF